MPKLRIQVKIDFRKCTIVMYYSYKFFIQNVLGNADKMIYVIIHVQDARFVNADALGR